MAGEDPYSNLSMIPFELDGWVWNSAEQYYQAAKFSDPGIISDIRTSGNPYRCAALGQTRRFPIRAEWESVKVSVMERAIRARFEQHPELCDRLKLSRGKLYDHTAEDSFWGIGTDGLGLNMTGHILMKIRSELITRENGEE